MDNKEYSSAHFSLQKSSNYNHFPNKHNLFHSSDIFKHKSVEPNKGHHQNSLFPPLNQTNIKFKNFIENHDSSNIIKANQRNFSVLHLNEHFSNNLQKKNFQNKSHKSDTYNSTDYTDVSNNDLNALISFYNTVKDENKSTENIDKRKKDEILRKFAIKQDNFNNSSNLIESQNDCGSCNRSKNKNRVVIVKNEYFHNQYSAMNELKLNKKIHDKVLDIFSQKQVHTYLHDYEKLIEEQNKILKMPEIRKIELGNLPLKAQIAHNLSKDNQLPMNPRSMILSYLGSLNPNILYPRKGRTSLKISKEVLFSNSLYFQGINLQMTKLKPKSRTCSTCCIYEGQMIVFGGLNSEGLDDIWASDLEKGFIWKNLNPSGAKRPLGRYGHSVVSFQNELYFFGGLFSNSIAPEEDLLIYSLSKNKWEYQRINHINKLGHRRNHIAHLIGPNMIIYGGINLSEDILGDLWLLDLVTLDIRSIDEKGSKPSKLAYIASTLVLDSEKAKQSSISIYKFPETQKKKYRNKYEGIYMFGGLDSDSNVRGELRILRLGVKPVEWIEAKTSGNLPQARSNASLNYLENINILILFGGQDNKLGVIFNDLFVLDLDSFIWYKVGMYDDHPIARYDHSSVIYDNKLICFGGMSNNHFIGSDIYVVNIDFGENKDKRSLLLNNYHVSKVPFKSFKQVK